jgi:hypothetical protein
MIQVVAAGTPIAAGMKDLIRFSPFWSEAPESEILRENEIHVWLVGVDDGSFCVRCGTDLLSSDEQERPRGSNFKTIVVATLLRMLRYGCSCPNMRM